MKRYLLLMLVVVAGISCSRQKEVQKSAAELNAVPVTSEAVDEKDIEKPIVEIEEKLVEVEEEPPADFRYFVIIGSFRIRDNANDYQADIIQKGFAPVLLRNEAGFYRVSVKSTDDILAARNEIRRIREQYEEHGDTWLLIRKD